MALIVSYADGYRNWDDAVERTQMKVGNIFVMVVKERRRNATDVSFTYGFFFRSSEGVLADVHKKSKMELLTLFRTDDVLVKLDAIYEGQFNSFEIPLKSEQNVVHPGSLADSTLPSLAFHYSSKDKI